MKGEIQLWSSKQDISLGRKNKVSEIVSFAKQLSLKDQKQIQKAFEVKNYQMLSTYVWSKTITAIKDQLSKMGPAFIGEMLNRPDITENTNIQHVITDFEAIQLAEDLGIVGGKSAFRLKQSMDLVTYFNNPDIDDTDDDDFTREDAIIILKSCIQGVLGYDKIELQIDFINFRKSLEERTLNKEDPNIQRLLGSPIFFKRTTVRILLSIIKSISGAHLENVLANANLIIPLIWEEIRDPEKWQIGRCYAELFIDGQTKAASGVKQVLLKVKGFDYVPEDLRSTSFIKVANEILQVHEGLNNFYLEAGPTRTLLNMGSVVPMPAFPNCMTAVLSVKLGNIYGVSHEAQRPADAILKGITKRRWIYYFDECLPTDFRILYKITQNNPRKNWIQLLTKIDELDDIISDLSNPQIKLLLKACRENNNSRALALIEKLNSNYN